MQTVFHALQNAVIELLELIQIARPDQLTPSSLLQELLQQAESVVIIIFPTPPQSFVLRDMLLALDAEVPALVIALLARQTLNFQPALILHVYAQTDIGRLPMQQAARRDIQPV